MNRALEVLERVGERGAHDRSPSEVVDRRGAAGLREHELEARGPDLAVDPDVDAGRGRIGCGPVPVPDPGDARALVGEVARKAPAQESAGSGDPGEAHCALPGFEQTNE